MPPNASAPVISGFVFVKKGSANCSTHPDLKGNHKAKSGGYQCTAGAQCHKIYCLDCVNEYWDFEDGLPQYHQKFCDARGSKNISPALKRPYGSIVSARTTDGNVASHGRKKTKKSPQPQVSSPVPSKKVGSNHEDQECAETIVTPKNSEKNRAGLISAQSCRPARPTPSPRRFLKSFGSARYGEDCLTPLKTPQALVRPQGISTSYPPPSSIIRRNLQSNQSDGRDALTRDAQQEPGAAWPSANQIRQTTASRSRTGDRPAIADDYCTDINCKHLKFDEAYPIMASDRQAPTMGDVFSAVPDGTGSWLFKDHSGLDSLRNDWHRLESRYGGLKSSVASGYGDYRNELAAYQNKVNVVSGQPHKSATAATEPVSTREGREED